MNDKNVLDKLHKVHLEMLDMINSVCRKHKISYFLDSGTALGAVRHKGFIPWDDDVDIGMPREDYKRFLEVVEPELGERIALQVFENEPNYNNFHAKLRLKNTLFPQDYTINFKYRGIQIDIFPFDYLANDEKKRLKQMSTARKVRTLCDIKGSQEWPQKLHSKAFYFAVRLIPLSVYRNLFENICQKYNALKTDYMTCFSYRMTRKKNYVFKTKDIIPIQTVLFENHKYMIMNNPDAYLKTMYGDYMKLPPEEDRVTHINGDIAFDLSDVR